MVKQYDYNEIAKVYDQVRESDQEMMRFMLETSIAKKAKDGKKIRILEIGCGTGNNLAVIRQIDPEAELWGIDSSVGMLAKAKDKCEGALLFEDDATKLSNLKDNMFDLVFMVDVIHHINDIDSMFGNIRRVLRQSGQVMVYSDSHEHIRNRLTTKYFPETLQAELGRYQDTDEIEESLSRQGFDGIDSGIIKLGVQKQFGHKLIEIAEKKGYSMFGLIPDEAIASGIQRIRKDMEKGDIAYVQQAPFVRAVKSIK